MFEFLRKTKMQSKTQGEEPSTIARDKIVAELSSVWYSWINSTSSLSAAIDKLSSHEKRFAYVRQISEDRQRSEALTDNDEYIQNLAVFQNWMNEVIETKKLELAKQIKEWVGWHNKLAELRNALDEYNRTIAVPELQKEK